MNYRNLGRTGVKVSPLCLGCMMFGGPTDQDQASAIVDAALEAGINFMDTADAYARGKSEEMLGNALERNGKRDRVILATKVHGAMGDDPNLSRDHRRHIIEGCHASLRRLKTDWIDLYQLHRPNPDIALDESLRALDDLVRAGKVRYVGTSTFMAWEITASLWCSKEWSLNRFICEQPPYSLLDRRVERELIPMTQTFGLGVIPWSPTAGGLLTGKYRRGQTPTEGRYAKRMAEKPQEFAQVFAVVEKLEELAGAKGCTASQLALAWCMHQPGITAPIVGPRTLDQLKDNLGALSVQVTDADRKALDAVAPPGGVIYPFYFSANWGPHLHRW